MRPSSLTLRMVAAILLLCLILIPMSSSVSMTQDRSPSVNASTRVWGVNGMNERAIVGISAAVVAAGAFLSVTADDNRGAASQHR
jgi:hypothetical protein